MRRVMGVVLIGITTLSACAEPAAPPPSMPPPTMPPTVVDPANPPPDAMPPPAATSNIRFVVLGDQGEGNDAQRAVAIAIRDLCALRGCNFAVLLGDNIYDEGVESVDDPQWQEKFEVPYADVDLPFYAVLGNHDYGGQLLVSLPGIGNEFYKGPVEVAYSAVSTKWRMPATHYTFTVGNVGFIMLDTNSILWNNTENGDQWSWYPAALQSLAGMDWIFVAGHHPYRSNGAHGNAGNYESLGSDIPNPVPLLNGDSIQRFMETAVCGTASVYFCGHDHNRQWLNEPTALCGTEMIVSGAGAKTTELHQRGNQVYFEDASEVGFMYVTVQGRTLTGEFIDSTGTIDFQRTLER